MKKIEIHIILGENRASDLLRDNKKAIYISDEMLMYPFALCDDMPDNLTPFTEKLLCNIIENATEYDFDLVIDSVVMYDKKYRQLIKKHIDSKNIWNKDKEISVYLHYKANDLIEPPDSEGVIVN